MGFNGFLYGFDDTWDGVSMDFYVFFWDVGDGFLGSGWDEDDTSRYFEGVKILDPMGIQMGTSSINNGIFSLGVG